MCALGASCEKHVEPQLGDVLKEALGWGIIDGDVGLLIRPNSRPRVRLNV
jgi:hypothetical protein